MHILEIRDGAIYLDGEPLKWVTKFNLSASSEAPLHATLEVEIEVLLKDGNGSKILADDI